MLCSLKLYFLLITEFFKIGIFSFGGGFATLPFLLHIAQKYGWYTTKDLSQMIAIASITPGPVGLNVATYAGLKVDGLIGALLATSSEVLPALFIVIFVSKLLKKYRQNYYLKSVLEILRPVSCALLSVVVIHLFHSVLIENNSNRLSSFVLFLALLVMSFTKKKDVFWYILIGALVGAVFVSLGFISIK